MSCSRRLHPIIIGMFNASIILVETLLCRGVQHQAFTRSLKGGGVAFENIPSRVRIADDPLSVLPSGLWRAILDIAKKLGMLVKESLIRVIIHLLYF